MHFRIHTVKALKYPFRPAAWLVVALVAFCTPVKSPSAWLAAPGSELVVGSGCRSRCPSFWIHGEGIANRRAEFVELKSDLTGWVSLDS